MFPSNLEVSEIKKVLNELSALCFCPYGEAAISKLVPIGEYEPLNSEISKVKTLARYYVKSEFSEPENIEFIDNLLEKGFKVNFLLEEEFGRIFKTLNNACRFIAYLDSTGIGKELPVNFKDVDMLVAHCGYLGKYISDTGFIKPDATPLLSGIIQEKEICKSGIHKKLDKYLSLKKRTLQDNYYTVRDGRYVLPVKAGFKKDIKGVVRDTSQSGDTVFIEPYEVGELNDRLFLLIKREEREKESILRALTAELGVHADLIKDMMSEIGYFDSLLARVKYMFAGDLHFPRLSPGKGIFLKNAVHPVYAKKSGIIPNDFVIEEGKKILLITGPNGGGKTVSLKTISAVIILTQMAVPTPVSEQSVTGIYKKVYFDMGDTQDMEAGMSSFTAKMHLWKDILDNADEDSLVVVDELGSFTNPYEGAAISCAFIAHLLNKGATLIAGTHLDQIKEYVSVIASAETASMLWDADNMKPRYMIIYGTASGSFAVDMAKKIGFSEKFIEECEKLLNSDYIYLEGIRRKYEHALSEAEENSKAVEAKLEELKRVADEKKLFHQKLKEENRHITDNYRTSVEKLLKLYREKIDSIPKERRIFRNASDDLIKEFKEINLDFFEKLNHGAKRKPEIGDNVYIPGLKREGKIVGIDADKVQILSGSMKFSIPLDDILESTGGDKGDVKPSARSHGHKAMDDFQPGDAAADLRGRKVDEALPILDKMIDNAILLGLREIKIIHGAGKGNLREAVHAFLKTHRMIKSFKTGGYLNRGGSYYTLAEIK